MKHLFALLLSLASVVAHADVFYQWHSNNDATPYNIQFELSFTDAAVSSNHVSLNAKQYGDTGADSGLIKLYYKAPNQARTVVFDPAAPNGVFSWAYQLDLNMLADGTLSGSIYANNGESHIRMGSNGNLFTVLDANSDAGMVNAGCMDFASCAGATGYFNRISYTAIQGEQLDLTSDVPEPASLALMGLGLISFAGLRRKT